MMPIRKLTALFVCVISPIVMLPCATPTRAEQSDAIGDAARTALERIGTGKDICVVLGHGDAGPDFVTDLARGSELLVYFQSPDAKEVSGVRRAADLAALLGQRVFVEHGSGKTIELADNLAGAVLVGPSAPGEIDEGEILRVLYPGGKAVFGERELIKPAPPGLDDWSHPYHGPDNNPQSRDRIARAPYLTQFLAEPKFSPMPEVSVISGGKIFKAFGHIAHKANQNAVLNTLMCINAYNGMILWRRELKEGFMIHRNTMIATPEVLYMADDTSCKLIDVETGKVRDEIVIPKGTADGPVWKWMAMEKGVLYALIGGKEYKISTIRSNNPALGHWPWDMWDGHEYGDPRKSFGFGRALVAIDPATKKILWTHREQDFLDSRGMCMKNGRIYFYCPDKFLACLDASTAKLRWKTSAPDLLEAISPNERAQHYVTGYATTTYIKCTDRQLFFAGPQRSRLVVVRAEDGKLLWQKEGGNLQLVLREDGFFAAGPQGTGSKMDYDTGEVLVRLPRRRACTRATGSIDSIFFRTPGGTVRVAADSGRAQHIAPMRPPCQDGVLIAGGLLYWGPWMCGCQLSLYGHISLAPVGSFNLRPDDPRLEFTAENVTTVEPFKIESGDWPSYRGDNQRAGLTDVAVPRAVRSQWRFRASPEELPTAPVVAGDTVFVGDRRGVVYALDASGAEKWRAYTGGAIYFSPAVALGRVYVGSADGRVHAFEARTGRPLWRFRVAPARRRIPVYGKLISTWPVSGGVVVDGGVVYAAAGIAHYDGTHVVALDAITGKLRWHNDTSGALSKEADSGVSMQGDVYLEDGEVRFLGGGRVQTARFDQETGKCLNTPRPGVNSPFRTAFYPYYPRYAEYLSFRHVFPDGKALWYRAEYEGSRHSSLALRTGLPAPEVRSDRARRRSAATKAEIIWEVAGQRFNSIVLAGDVVLAAGQAGDLTGDPEGRRPFLAAFNLKDGSRIWSEELPAPAVKGGTAVDHRGRIVAALQNGDVLCFAGK